KRTAGWHRCRERGSSCAGISWELRGAGTPSMLGEKLPDALSQIIEHAARRRRRHTVRIHAQQTIRDTARLYVQMKVRHFLPTGRTIGLPQVESGRMEHLAQRPRYTK